MEDQEDQNPDNCNRVTGALQAGREASALLNSDHDNNGPGDDGDEDDGDDDGDADDKRNICPCASTTFGVLDIHTMSFLTCGSYNKFQLQVYHDSV